MDKVNIIFSFDTTGSMYPCIGQVKNSVEKTVQKLFKDIPNLKIGIISHGDYCDGPNVMNKLDLTNDVNKVVKFIKDAPSTHGGDAPECYELCLHEARSFAWEADATKAFVLIGDDVPHSPHERQNFKSLDWRNEIKLLLEAGIHVYGVQALQRFHATSFYKEIASVTGGFHLQLNQFSSVVDMLFAICYKQQGLQALADFENEVESAGRMNRQNDAVFSTLMGRPKKIGEYSSSSYADAYSRLGSSSGASSKTVGSFVADYSKIDTSLLEPVNPARFQIISVDSDCSIKEFVESNGLIFKKGAGFYQHRLSTKVQDYKEIVLFDKKTGDMFTGKAARVMLGLPETGTINLTMSHENKFVTFIQSTSVNRKLEAGTSFLYEVDLSR